MPVTAALRRLFGRLLVALGERVAGAAPAEAAAREHDDADDVPMRVTHAQTERSLSMLRDGMAIRKRAKPSPIVPLAGSVAARAARARKGA